MKNVIGLAGAGGVGKSTTAEAICVINPRFGVVPIGSPIRAMLEALYQSYDLEPDEIDRRLHGDLKRHPCPMLCDKTPTFAMQTLGTEWGRELVGSELWLDWWRSEVSERLSLGEGVINDSVRFVNEANAVRDLGGIVVELYGRGNLAKGHASENGVKADARIKVDREPMEIAYEICNLL